MLFNGSGASERVDVFADGRRIRFFRDVAAVTIDVDGIETLDAVALGGADTVSVNDLGGTAVTNVAVNLAGVIGGAARRHRR